MEIKYCPNCGIKLSPEQNFCANCGANLRFFKGYTGDFKEQLEKMMRDLLENNADALKELAEKIEKGESIDKGLFLSVDMRDGKPIIKSGNVEDFEDIIKNAPIPSFVKEMMEKERGVEFRVAEVSVQKIDKKTEISVYMPGITALKDVETKRNENNLELAGKVGNIIYFAQIPIGDDSIILGTRLIKDVVKVDVERTL